MAGRAFEPDIKEVRQFGIHNVVVIGGVHHYSVDAAVPDVVEAVAGLAGNRDRRRRIARHRCPGEEIVAAVGLRTD